MLEVVDQVGVPPQVLDVDGGPSADQYLQLLFVEDLDEPVGDQVVEALEEGLQLLLDAGGHFGV